MTFWARLLLLIAMLGLAPDAFAQSRWSRTTRPTAARPGSDYVRLWDWARANGFDVRWLRPDKVLELSSRTGNRLTFTAKSREVIINGVEVLLSFPVTVNGGAGWISSLDLRTAIQPILYPVRNPRGDKVRTIVLDPGHGGKDDGAHNGPHEEKKYTLLLAQELRSQLMDAGFLVSLTRTTDVFVDLPPRPDMANRRNADLFISLHFNTVPYAKSQVRGAQVYCMTPVGASSTNARGEGAGSGASTGNRNDSKNVLLAYQLQKTLVKNLGAEDRGVCRGRLAVLRDVQMPAVLIEGGYISNPVEVKKIADVNYRRQMAQAIVKGVLAYKNLVEQ